MRVGDKGASFVNPLVSSRFKSPQFLEGTYGPYDMALKGKEEPCYGLWGIWRAFGVSRTVQANAKLSTMLSDCYVRSLPFCLDDVMEM